MSDNQNGEQTSEYAEAPQTVPVAEGSTNQPEGVPEAPKVDTTQEDASAEENESTDTNE